MDENFFRKTTTLVILAILLVLSFFLLQPLLMSVIMGFVLAFIFFPIYNWFCKITKSKNFSAALICVILILLIILPIWFFTPTLLDESVKFYRASQNLDIVTPLKAIFPSLFASEEFSQQAGIIIHSGITGLTNSLMNYFSKILLDLPTILLQIFVIFFTFFYALRDKENLISYIKSLLPFSKEVEKKLFESTKDITFSVLYGYVVIGTLQGIIQGIGFFVFGVPNAIILTILAVIAGILPVIGPTFIGVPVALFLLIGGNSVAAWGIIIFTAIASLSDHFIRPLMLSQRTNLPIPIALVGMVGGFLLFGILGFILGPLIIAYLIIIIEVYRKKDTPSALTENFFK